MLTELNFWKNDLSTLLTSRQRIKVPITLSLIGISVFVTLISWFGENIGVLSVVVISKYSSGLAEVRDGEVWRLLTPAFLHFHIFHIVFNLLFVWVLGSLIEQIKGSGRLLLIFMVAAAGSNLSEYLVSGPVFGGMSGVVYSFLGYVWMQTKYNRPNFPQVLPPALVPTMMIWYAVCWTGLVGPIANFAHTGGLVIGIVWGKIDATGKTKTRI